MEERLWQRFYDPGVPTSLEYPAVPVQHFLRESAWRWPEHPCTILGEEVITFREMDERSDRLAGALVRLGVGRGERVGLYLPNSPAFVLAYFAILKAGGAVAAANPAYTAPELTAQAADAGIRLLFAAEKTFEKAQAARAGTAIRTIIVSGDIAMRNGDLRLEDVVTERKGTLPGVSAEDVAVLQYSGGTTGPAKGAMALHRNLVANTLQFQTWMVSLEAGRETTLLAIPMYHVYGMVCGMCLSMALGAGMVLLPGVKPLEELLEAVQRWHPTYFPAVPTLYNAINSQPEVQAGHVDLSSIKACISGSAPLMKETKERFEALTGGHICEGYGLSEAPTATHCNPLLGRNKTGSIGLPLPDVDCRIVDAETGERDLPAGEVGELILKGPQVMRGYHNQPEESAAALNGGWLHTGDLARMDEQGYFFLVERKKDLIKPDGLQVWPREVEEALASHPLVHEAAVAGIPDPFHGEAVKAWVVLKPVAVVSEAELKEWCASRLAGYKIPAQVEFRKVLPKTGVGKVLRRELVRQHLEKEGRQ